MEKKAIELYESINTKFFHDLLKDQETMSESMTKHTDFKLGANNYHLLSDAQKTTSRTFRLVCDLTTVVEDIRLIYLLINKLPPKAYRDKCGFSELEYIKFHYEVFLHKVHTICEIMKLIANEVLDIRLHPKDCNWLNLEKNKAFKQSPSRTAINQYYSDFKDLIEDRNLNTHRGIFEDDKLADISSTYFIYQFHFKNGQEPDDEFKKMFPYVIVKHKMKRYRSDKLKEIARFEKNVFKHLNSFFSSLVWKI